MPTCDGDEAVVGHVHDVVPQRAGGVLGAGVYRQRPDAAPGRAHIGTPHLQETTPRA